MAPADGLVLWDCVFEKSCHGTEDTIADTRGLQLMERDLIVRGSVLRCIQSGVEQTLSIDEGLGKVEDDQVE